MGNYTKEQQFELIRYSYETLKLIDNQYEDVCLEAIENASWALEYVKEQTPKVCLAAIKINGNSIEYVKEQTPELCLLAVKKDAESIKKIKLKTPELCFYAFLGRNNLNEYKYIQKGVDDYIKEKHIFTKKIFCSNYWISKVLRDKNIEGYEIINLDVKSLIELKGRLIEDSYDNYFIFSNYDLDLDVIKKISLSNNILICVNYKKEIEDPVAKSLINKIVTREELLEESF